MGAAKNYFSNVICACSGNSFDQDAVEYAIITGMVQLDIDVPVAEAAAGIMHHYDAICDAYSAHMEALHSTEARRAA